MSSSFGSNVFPVVVGVVIIVLAIAIAFTVQGTPDKAMSQVVTVGPLWKTDTWSCSSDADFMVHATLRGSGEDPQIRIAVQGKGTQSIYHLVSGQGEDFTVGNQGGQSISITRTGTVTGFLTMQTTSDAKASCIAKYRR